MEWKFEKGKLYFETEKAVYSYDCKNEVWQNCITQRHLTTRPTAVTLSFVVLYNNRPEKIQSFNDALHYMVDVDYCTDCCNFISRLYTGYISYLLQVTKIVEPFFNIYANYCRLHDLTPCFNAQYRHVLGYDIIEQLQKQYDIKTLTSAYYKCLNEQGNADISFKDSLSALLKYMKLATIYTFCEEAGYPNVDKDYILTHRLTFDSCMQYCTTTEQKQVLCYYLIHLRMLELNSYLYSTVIAYIQQCAEMGKQPIKTTNCIREFVETKKSYTLWKTIRQNENIAKVMNKYAKHLTFETNDFVVKLPTCGQDLVKEGNEMHHCVGSYIDEVANEKTLIVFIRKKSNPEKCYITAQVNVDTGALGQYYLAYDHRITSLEDKEFKLVYQNHLYKMFN